MIELTVVTNPQSAATDFYRSVGPLWYIQKATAGVVNINCITPDSATWFSFFTSDIVFFSRPNGNMLLDIITEVKDMGKRVWVDYDDLLDSLSDYNPAKVHFERYDVKESVKLILAMADAVSVSTQYLKDKYQDQTRNEITVLKNAYDPNVFRFNPVRPQSEPIRLHWRGSATHLGDLMTVKPVLDYAITSEQWSVKFHGLQKWMLHAYPDGYQIAEWENRLFRYFRTLGEERPDWVVFPLIDDPFNQSKSNISAIEALNAGAGVLAPSGFPEFVLPGVINYDSPEHLRDIFDQIEKGELNKEETVMAGRQWLREFLTVENENEKRMELIGKLTGARFTKKVEG